MIKGKNLPNNFNSFNKLQANKSSKESNSRNNQHDFSNELYAEEISAEPMTRNKESNKTRKNIEKSHLSSNISILNNFTISTINNSINSVEKNITELEEYIEKGYYNHAIPQRKYISEELKLILSRLLKVEEKKRTIKYYKMVNHYLELMEKLNEINIKQKEPNMNNFTSRRSKLTEPLVSSNLSFITENNTLQRNPYKTDKNILDMFNEDEEYSKINKRHVTLPITNNIQEKEQINLSIFNEKPPNMLKKINIKNSKNEVSMLNTIRSNKQNVKHPVIFEKIKIQNFEKIKIQNSENKDAILKEISDVIGKIYRKTSLKIHPNRGGNTKKFQDFSNYNENIEDFLSNKCNIISPEEIDSIIVLTNKTIDNIARNGFNENIILKMFEKLNSIVEKSKSKFTQNNKVKGFIIGEKYNIKINEKYELCQYIGYVDNTFIFCKDDEKILVKDAKKIKPMNYKGSTVKKMYKFFSKK